MNKGQFGLLTAALGLATMAGAGYVGYAHADSGHPRTNSGSSGTVLSGGDQGELTGPGGTGATPAGGSSASVGPAEATTGAAGAASPSLGGSLGTSSTQASAPECGDGDIQVAEAGGQGAAGHLSMIIEFTNVSDHTCYLHGYPGASMLGASGEVLSNAVRTLVGPSGGAQGVKSPQRIVLQVNGAASAVVEWSDVSSGSGACLSPDSLGVTPPDEKQTTTLQLSGQPEVCSGFQVHPVVQGVSSSG